MAAVAKYQVFISSTYEDLKEERDQVIRAVLEMGHIPVGMEMFSAADDEQWQIIARHIDESDYYAVIVAHRIGSMTDDGVSYTRKEYEYALGKGTPILGFLVDEGAKWPADRVETGTGAKRALSEFKTRIREKPVAFWSNAEDLYGRFSIALMKAITAHPREGWVRASSVGSRPEVTAEVIRLSAENASLRQQISEAEKASHKEQSDERKRTVEIMLANKRKLSYRYTTRGEWQYDSEVSLFSIFQWLGPEMIVEASVRDLSGSLAMWLRMDKDKSWDVVALNQMKDALADLMTLDLVQPSKRKHAVSDKEEYWSLSLFGSDILRRIRKIMLSDESVNSGEDEPVVEESEQQGSDEEGSAMKVS